MVWSQPSSTSTSVVGSRLAPKRVAGTTAFHHFINRAGVIVKRDDLAIRRCHPPKYRGALRGVCAAACKRTGTGPEAGGGRDRAGRGSRCGKRNGAVVDAARRGAALPPRSVGAAGRTLRRERDASDGGAARASRRARPRTWAG